METITIDEYMGIKDEELLGLELSEALHHLGCWWTLSHQKLGNDGCTYNMVRPGKGTLRLYTDRNNIVKNIGKTFWLIY